MGPVASRFQSFNNRIFKRTTRDRLRADLQRLGLAPGDLVFANVSMRCLGFVRGGPPEVIGAILDTIGPSGTLVLPGWPQRDPATVDPRVPFDLEKTPSQAGALSEALRQHPGAERSLHPIASVIAAGAMARQIVEGHEAAATPFGDDSPYGRVAQRGPRLLLAGAHVGGILFHVQDRVGFPNLYTSDRAEFRVRDGRGSERTVTSLRLRADVPPVVILQGNRPESRDYMLVPDYALLFPPEREARVLEAGYLRHNRSRFLGRKERLRARGILATGPVGAAEAALLDGARMLEQISKDLSWDLARYKEEYDPEQLARLGLPVF